jgi:adenylate cyclase
MVRRLAAILAADVVGYSTMMARDESGTLAQFIAFRQSVFDPQITAHNGRIVKLMGDGALVEFASVVDAVECAVAIQSEVVRSPQTDLRLRIGINLGDVIPEGRDIYGDGVNIAARLECLAETGGICISGIVRQSISNRIDARFDDAGEHLLKNMDQPVQVFRWVPEGGIEEVLAPAKANATGKPAFAVLAFDNMSADPEQEYFSDGIAEDIITALSHFREFAVIARNTSFTYKGQPIRVDEVCRDLGVGYLLEGSVRKSGNMVRVTAQLIDGESGAHIWAGRFDREMDDIFTVQDEITEAIVAAAAPETMQAELRRARVKPFGNHTAWDKVLQARWHLGKFSRKNNAAARALLEQACLSDPDLSDGNAAIAQCDLMDALHVWCDDIVAALSSAR